MGSDQAVLKFQQLCEVRSSCKHLSSIFFSDLQSFLREVLIKAILGYHMAHVVPVAAAAQFHFSFWGACV